MMNLPGDVKLLTMLIRNGRLTNNGLFGSETHYSFGSVISGTTSYSQQHNKVLQLALYYNVHSRIVIYVFVVKLKSIKSSVLSRTFYNFSH